MRWQLISAWCGPVFVVLFVLFWGWIGGNLPNPGPNLTADQIAAHYRTDTTSIRIGFVGAVVFMCLYMPWSAVLSARMARIEGNMRTLSYLQLIGGAIVGLHDKSSDPLFPRWMCWYAIWAGCTFLPASLTAFLKVGAFSWSGIGSYYFPYFAWLSWFGLFSFYIIRAINRERATLA